MRISKQGTQRAYRQGVLQACADKFGIK